MYATMPIYYSSIDYAYKHKEEELWRENFRINMELRKFVNDRASTAYNTRELDLFIKDLVEDYGVKRAMYVLGRTIQYKEWDGRFDAVVKKRAAQLNYTDSNLSQDDYEKYGSDKSQEYVTEIHPVILNQIYRELMKMEVKDNELAQEDKNEDLTMDELDI